MSSRPEIHLINPLWNSAGGSEWRTIEMYRELAPHADVQLWTEHKADPRLAALVPIQQIDAERGRFPRGGVFVFVGVYSLPGSWLAASHPRRTVVVYNIRKSRSLVRFLAALSAQQVNTVEIVYASEMLQQYTKLPGIVQFSPIDLQRFSPDRGKVVYDSEAFVVGRLSRNLPTKHHPADMALYEQLVAAGCKVRIMGGSCLAKQGPVPQGVELLRAKVEPAETFLAKLNCFLYRTSAECWESFGRVVHEAMACGLPVVCHRDGGYATSIERGRNGFLFDTDDEALSIVRRLKEDRSLRASVSMAARQTVEMMYSPAERAKVVAYYLR